MTEARDLIEQEEISLTEEEAMQALDAIAGAHALMLKEIRSWGIWLLGFGVLHVLTSGFLSAPWGIMLIVVGLGSFVFRSASMFIVYGVTLAWAAISNLSSFEVTWVVFSLLQVYMAYRTFRQYGRFNKVESAYSKLVNIVEEDGSIPADRTARWFPWLSLLLGCSSFFGLVLLFSIVIVLAIASEDDGTVPGYFDFLFGLLMNAGVLGFSVGLASVLARHRPLPVAVIGTAAGALALVVHLALRFL